MRWIAPALIFLALPTGGWASQSGGPGFSFGCTGFSPWPCARTDAAVQQDTLPTSFIPQVNVPFIDTFGERMVRISSPGSPVATGMAVDTAGGGMGQFDPTLNGSDGGYRFIVPHEGGALFMYTLDPKTMTTQRVISSFTSCPAGATGCIPLGLNGPRGSPDDPRAFIGSGRGTAPNYNDYSLYVYCAPGASSDPTCTSLGTDYDYGSPNYDSLGTLYDFRNCPNIPADYANGDWGVHQGIVSAAQDGSNSVLMITGGTSQNYQIIAAMYNPSNGHCDWYDTESGQVGGDDYSGVQQTDAVLPAPSSVTAHAFSSGSPLPTTGVTYDVMTTFQPLDNDGQPIPVSESLASPAKAISVGSGQAIEVDRPVYGTDERSKEWSQFGAQKYYQYGVYACEPDPCSPKLIEYSLYAVSGSTIDSTNWSTSGASTPTQTTSGFFLHGGQFLSQLSRQWVRLSQESDIHGDGGQVDILWNPEGGGSPPSIPLCSVAKQTGYMGGCSGHPFGFPAIMGHDYTTAPTNGQNPGSDIGGAFLLMISTLTYLNLTPSGPQPSLVTDSHYNEFFNTDPTGELAGPVELNPYTQDTTLLSNGIDGPGNPWTTRTRIGWNDSVMLSDFNRFSGFCSPSPCGSQEVFQMYDPHLMPAWINLSGSPLSSDEAANGGLYSALYYQDNPTPDNRYAVFTSNFMDRLGPDSWNQFDSQTYIGWTANTSVSTGTVWGLPAGATYPNFTSWMVATTGGTTGASAPGTWNTSVGQITQDNGVNWESWGANPCAPGTMIGANFPRWSANTAYYTNQFIADPNGVFEFATSSGTSGSSAPPFPDWTVTTASQAGTTLTINLSVSPSGLSIGDKVALEGTSNKAMITGTSPLTVSGVSGSQVTATWNIGQTASTTGGMLWKDAGTVADGGVTWTQYIPQHFTGVNTQMPFLPVTGSYAAMQLYPLCRRDDFVVELR